MAWKVPSTKSAANFIPWDTASSTVPTDLHVDYLGLLLVTVNHAVRNQVF